MKNSNALRLLVLVVGLAALPFIGARAVASVDGVDPSTDHLWSAIKGDTYDTREHFAEGSKRLSEKLSEQIQELHAKRAAMTTDTKDWDLAMKEVDNSSDLLTGRVGSLPNATTPETWIDAKDKIGEAWKNSQLAVDKMNSTRTS